MDSLSLAKRDIATLPPLAKGSHDEASRTACVMEAVAWVAGEPWSDQPECACPVLTSWLQRWNDSLPSDAERDRLLRPLVPRLVGTRADAATERRRSEIAWEWLVKEHVPAWLRQAGLAEHAATLERLDMSDTETVERVLAAARVAARDAARVAAGVAAGDAARDAARDALAPTVAELQESAFRCIDRMIVA